MTIQTLNQAINTSANRGEFETEINTLAQAYEASKGLIVGTAAAAAILGGVVSIGLAGVCDANASGKSRAIGLVASAAIASAKAAITDEVSWSFTTGVVVTQVVGHGVDYMSNSETIDDTL